MIINRQQRTAVLVALRQGRTAIFPTESSYAIGCRINSRRGIAEIMQRKGRKDQRFTVVAASVEQIRQFFRISETRLKLGKKHWPGAVSLIVSNKYAVRVPAMALLRNLAKQAGAPLIASSLNQSGRPTIFDLKKLVGAFKDLPQIDVGKLPIRLPSTVIAVKRNRVVVVRLGSASIGSEFI
ncbi:MAG: hypothetical protein ACD_43C00126G0004 [uncultured bacterium]|nr:MAG: hypothetical protein ACD_43C00126G0004 [uncultured bacterium]